MWKTRKKMQGAECTGPRAVLLGRALLVSGFSIGVRGWVSLVRIGAICHAFGSFPVSLWPSQYFLGQFQLVSVEKQNTAQVSLYSPQYFSGVVNRSVRDVVRVIIVHS
jgi:hypothetical protein